jgi:tetratricopeptide (TPR) repeat protein
MKKIILTLVLCLSVAGPSFAQNNTEAMKFLTINALMQYGQKLYERGDFNEATAVFNHVLTYDGHQVQALEYIKEMRHSPVDISDTQSLKEAIEAKKQVIERLRNQIMQMRANLAAQSVE